MTDFVGLAADIAREAGDMLLAKRPARPEAVETKSSQTDVVTALDRASEELIRARIHAARPDDAILGEEGGETGAGRVRWLVDPIDGTVNFMYGLPDWAVSVAVEVDGEIVAGVVNVPTRGELFTASRGGGADLSRAGAPPERLACNTGVPLPQAMIATGFGYLPERRVVQGQVVSRLIGQVRDIRRRGSAAVDLCSVASGQVDAYYERGLMPWDLAAGGLIASESGARIGGLRGAPHSTEFVVCAAPGLFEDLHDLLVPLHPDRDA